MARISNWPGALDAYIEANKFRSFVWGSHDCILFACGGIEAITGHDPAAEWRGNYNSALSAARIFKEYGGFEEMINFVATANGYEERSVKMAQRGDLILHANKWPTAGLCCGRLSAFVDINNLFFVKTADCLKSWRVE